MPAGKYRRLPQTDQLSASLASPQVRHDEVRLVAMEVPVPSDVTAAMKASASFGSLTRVRAPLRSPRGHH